VLRIFAATTALFIFWLLCSGFFTNGLLLSFGVGSCALAVWLGLRMDVIDDEGQPIHLGWRVWLYLPWLVVEIVKANIAVARLILDPSLPISPTTYYVRASQKSDLGKVIYANSITLTPGTVTMDMDGDKLLVHAVSVEMIADQDENEMDRRVTALEVQT